MLTFVWGIISLSLKQDTKNFCRAQPSNGYLKFRLVDELSLWDLFHTFLISQKD